MITIRAIKEELEQIGYEIVAGANSELEFFLWDLKEMDNLNKSYEVEHYHKGYYAIGSDGGVEMLTVELTSGMVYRIPFISIDNAERIKVADSIADLTGLPG